MKYLNITFTNTTGILEEYTPKPASKFIPNWYKQTESYINGDKKPVGNGSTAATIKRCMPVFDSINAGYIIQLPGDIYVSQREENPWYEWTGGHLIEWHPVAQAPLHPKANGHPYPKFINGWSMQTPKGYSVLIVQPFHRDAPFTILPGIVDTDNYNAPINFPFVLNDPKFEGLIPAGTPIAQVIPFKRDNWEMKLGGIQEFQKSKIDEAKTFSMFFDKYKNMFRQPKEYK